MRHRLLCGPCPGAILRRVDGRRGMVRSPGDGADGEIGPSALPGYGPYTTDSPSALDRRVDSWSEEEMSVEREKENTATRSSGNAFADLGLAEAEDLLAKANWPFTFAGRSRPGS